MSDCRRKQLPTHTARTRLPRLDRELSIGSLRTLLLSMPSSPVVQSQVSSNAISLFRLVETLFLKP